MLRFLCFAFDPDDQDTADQVNVLRRKSVIANGQWTVASNTPGIEIWHAKENPVIAGAFLKDTSHAIIGRIFTRDGVELSKAPPVRQAAAIKTLMHDTRNFMANHWGSYVAFGSEDGGRSVVIARDPSGALPCYVSRFGRARMFFSDIHDALACLPLKLTIDARFVEASLLLPHLPKRISGFHEIAEVLPGERWSIKSGIVEMCHCWDPYQLIGDEETVSAETAASTVLTTAKMTVSALAGCFDRINVQLGGLDSSAVLALLASTSNHPSINALNLFTKSPRGDERYFARRVAEDLGLVLMERELMPDRISFDQVVASSRQMSPKPFLDLLNIAGDVYYEPAIVSSNASFTGVGGDSIFLQGAGYLPALDYAEKYGLTLSLAPIIANSARYSRISVVSVLGKVVRALRNPKLALDHIRDNEMRTGRYACLSDRLAEMTVPLDLLHPGLIPPDSISKGKCLQVMSSCFSPVEYYDRFAPTSELERVDVFLTQPMIETCLRIPSWILAHRGIDRGLERKAFAAILPDEIIRRRTKSTPQEVYDQFIATNRRRIFDYLLDGELLGRDMISKSKVQDALRVNSDETAIMPLAVLNLLQWEAWLRGWS